ncbi:MAG TPA: DNA polymerase Y family protein [Alphaproteobacteria bacterium]|nr:DNA polymerase Y family protein [Alphaproteobacteria bacterium]
MKRPVSKRIVSLWLLTLATDRIARQSNTKPPEAKGETPLVTAAGERGRLVVAGVNQAARTLGITPIMALADARALVPGLGVAEADPMGDAKTLAGLAGWCGRYTPWAAVEAGTPPGSGGLWLDVTGCDHLFGGEAALLDDMVRRLQRLGFAARAALADTPGAAWAWARFGDPGDPILPPGGAKDALADLPVAALRLAPEDVDTLGRLGLRRIGALYDLPRAPLTARLGSDVRRRLEQMLGALAEPISPRLPAAPFTARLAFPEPVGLPTDIEAALERLLAMLCSRLEAAHLGARRTVFTIHRADGSFDTVGAGASRPSRDPRHLMRLLAPSLERLDPAGPDGHSGVEVAVLAFPVVAAFEAGQRAMPQIGAGNAHEGNGTLVPSSRPAHTARTAQRDPEIAALADRLAGRLGPANVRALGLRESHWPERAARSHALLDGPPPISAKPRDGPPRPLRLLARPEPVEVTGAPGRPAAFRWRTFAHKVTRIEGPERIAPEWWLALGAPPGAARDYYRMEDRAGRRFWLYREVGTENGQRAGDRGRWFLHGQFG